MANWTQQLREAYQKLHESVEDQIREVGRAERKLKRFAHGWDGGWDKKIPLTLASTKVRGMPIAVSAGSNSTLGTQSPGALGVWTAHGKQIQLSAPDINAAFSNRMDRETLSHELAHATQYVRQKKTLGKNPRPLKSFNMKLRQPKIIPTNVSDLGQVNYTNQDIEVNARGVAAARLAQLTHARRIQKHLDRGLKLQDALNKARKQTRKKYMRGEHEESAQQIGGIVHQVVDAIPARLRPTERLPKFIRKVLAGNKKLYKAARSETGERIVNTFLPFQATPETTNDPQLLNVRANAPIPNRQKLRRLKQTLVLNTKAEKSIRSDIARGMQMAERRFRKA